MALDIQFAYVCEKKFSELLGTSDFKRHCPDCGLDVVNLDPLDEHARLELFEAAVQSGQRLCVSATHPILNSRSCKTRPPLIMRTAGIPVIPPPEKLHQERERIEQQKKSSWLDRLRSKG